MISFSEAFTLRVAIFVFLCYFVALFSQRFSSFDSLFALIFFWIHCGGREHERDRNSQP